MKGHSHSDEETKVYPGNPGQEEKAHESTQRWIPCRVTAAFPNGNPGFSLEKLLLDQRLGKTSHFPGKSQCNVLLFPLLSSHRFLNFLGCCCLRASWCKWDQQAQFQRREDREALKQLKLSVTTLGAKPPWYLYFLPLLGYRQRIKKQRPFLLSVNLT